jgi:hypothetical protein
MTPIEAGESWLKNFSPFYGSGVKLISPAVSNDPKSGNLNWLESFFGNCTQCAAETHAAALHWYSDSFFTLTVDPFLRQTYFSDAYQRLQRPIYITEFGVGRFTISSNLEEKQAFLEDVIVRHHRFLSSPLSPLLTVASF